MPGYWGTALQEGPHQGDLRYFIRMLSAVLCLLLSLLALRPGPTAEWMTPAEAAGSLGKAVTPRHRLWVQSQYQKDSRTAVFASRGAAAPRLWWSPHWCLLTGLPVPPLKQDVCALCLGTVLPAGLGTGSSEASRSPHLCAGGLSLSPLLCSYLFLLPCAARAGHCALSPLLSPVPRVRGGVMVGSGTQRRGSRGVQCWVWVQEGWERPKGALLLHLDCRAQACGLRWVIKVTQPVAELRLGPVTLTLSITQSFLHVQRAPKKVAGRFESRQMLPRLTVT